MNKLIFFAVTLSLTFFASVSSAQKKLTDSEIFARGYVLKPEEIKIADVDYIYGTTPILYKIENVKKKTKITFLQPIYFDSQWIHYTKGFSIINKKNGDQYTPIGYDDNIPMGQVVIVRGCNRKVIYVTLVYPRLKSNAKVIDIIESPIADDPTPSNNTGEYSKYLNVKVKEYSPKAIKKKAKISKLDLYK